MYKKEIEYKSTSQEGKKLWTIRFHELTSIVDKSNLQSSYFLQ